MPGKKVLYIPIQKEHFEKIKSGEKDWESREYKEHWIKRLMNPDRSFKTYDYVLFQNGYHTNAQQMLVEFKGVKIVKERKGLFKVEKEFEIELGRIIGED